MHTMVDAMSESTKDVSKRALLVGLIAVHLISMGCFFFYKMANGVRTLKCRHFRSNKSFEGWFVTLCCTKYNTFNLIPKSTTEYKSIFLHFCRP